MLWLIPARFTLARRITAGLVVAPVVIAVIAALLSTHERGVEL